MEDFEKKSEALYIVLKVNLIKKKSVPFNKVLFFYLQYILLFETFAKKKLFAVLKRIV